MYLDLTIAIPVKNEAKNIADCIKSIGKNFALNIDVIDSGSGDGTVEIARELGANIIQFTWDGKYPKKRNWYLLNHKPKTKWVLFLDADEHLTTPFKEALCNYIQKFDYAGYWLNYSIYMNNYKLKAGYPLKKLALFQTEKGLYEKIEENNWSKLDMEIHEHAIINGSVGFIKSKIDHKVNFENINWKQKHMEYAKWEAKRYLSLISNKRVANNFTFFQKIKYFIVNTPFAGISFFIGSYLFMLGFIDGIKGFKYALLKAFYFQKVYTEIKKVGK